MIKSISSLLLLLPYFSASSLAFTSKGFIENKGQVISGDGYNPILFYSGAADRQYFFTNRNITEVQYSSIPDRKNSKIIRKRATNLPSQLQGMTLKGNSILQHISNFYLAHQPSGILNVKSYSELIYSDSTGMPRYKISLDERGEPLLSSVSAFPNNQISKPELFSALPWSTFLGGTDADEGWSVDHDLNNDLIVFGQTQSLDFPVTSGNQQDTLNGLYDVFVSKFDNNGNLLWSTYFGSSQYDFAGKMSTGSDAFIYVVGYTNGTDLPVTTGCFQNLNAGSYDAFIAKFSPSGILIWSSYFGGNGGDLGSALTSMPNADIVIGGSVTGTTFPVTVGAFQSSNNGGMDCFISRLDSSGALIWSTFYGGTGSEDVHGTGADSAGNILVTGGSFSSDFPVSNGCFQNFNAGVKDAFILKFDGAGSRIFATYFGGTAFEDAADVNSDGMNNIYISGTTASTDFPVSIGCYQGSNSGSDDLFLMKMDAGGNQIWSTYFGGSGSENNFGMDSPGAGKFFLAGSTSSTDLPVIGPGPFISNQGSADVVIVKFSELGVPVWSTYYGGTLQDRAHAVSVNNSQDVALTGITSSADFPVSTNPYQGNNAGNDDAFVTVLDGTFDITSSFHSESGSNPEAEICPNPFKEGELFIRYDNPIERVVITNAAGINQYFCPHPSQSIKNRWSLFLPEFAPGLYLITIQSGAGQCFKKLIIQ